MLQMCQQVAKLWEMRLNFLHHAGTGNGGFDDLQIGSITIETVSDANKAKCSNASPVCDQRSTALCNAQKPQESELKYYYNGADTTDSLYRHDNLIVVDDLPQDFSGGRHAYARKYVF
jgi:hypothetical protein